MHPESMLGKLLVTIAALLIASPSLAGEQGIKDAPQWVNSGTGYESLQGNRIFHGVGSAPVMGDAALQKSAADGRARKELERILKTYLDDLSSQYKTTSSGDTQSATEDSATAQLAKLATPALEKAKTVATWRDHRTGLLYTLVQLDLNAIKQLAATSTTLSPPTREFIREYSDIVFDSESGYVEY